jgi:hypothetical protein
MKTNPAATEGKKKVQRTPILPTRDNIALAKEKCAVTDYPLDKIREVLGCTRNEALQIRGALLFQKQ